MRVKRFFIFNVGGCGSGGVTGPKVFIVEVFQLIIGQASDEFFNFCGSASPLFN